MNDTSGCRLPLDTITHVFFGLHGTLIDHALLEPCSRQAQADLLAARYGGNPTAWIAASRRVTADWDSYYADLDLDGDDNLDQLWEGQTRILRALFRLAERPYPPPEEMSRLVREQHYLITHRCDALYPDARAALEAIRADDRLSGLALGVISNTVSGHAEGCLEGAGVRDWFAGPVVGPDTVGRFGKDAGCFRFAFGQAQAAPGCCIVVDDEPSALRSAVEAGARAVLIDRVGRRDRGRLAPVLPDLNGLPDLLRRWLEARY